jgi:hypothetical protein
MRVEFGGSGEWYRLQSVIFFTHVSRFTWAKQIDRKLYKPDTPVKNGQAESGAASLSVDNLMYLKRAKGQL